MKKIFGLLLSIWIPIYLLFGLLASCEKSSMEEVLSINETTSPTQEVGKHQLAGSWRLKEFYQDIGNGQGNWIPAQNAEQVNFTESGDFSANEFFPLYDRHFNKYRIVDSTRVELYSTQSEETAMFIYKRESETSLLFNPACRENCAKRYTLIQ